MTPICSASGRSPSPCASSRRWTRCEGRLACSSRAAAPRKTRRRSYPTRRSGSRSRRGISTCGDEREAARLWSRRGTRRCAPCRDHVHAAPRRSRRGAGAHDLGGNGDRRQLSQCPRGLVRGRRGVRTRDGRSRDGGGLESAADRRRAIGLHRRRAGRSAHGPRWLDARSHASAQHGELPEGHDVQRG